MKLLIHYPTRSRAEQFISTLSKYVSLLSGKHEVQIVASADEDDASMRQAEVFSTKISLLLTEIGSIHYGNSKSKIEACNADMDVCPDWDIVLLASDDMIPQVQDYDDIIIQAMQQHFPDTDGALWFNDGTDATKKGLNTLSILGRKYYERFGYIYHPDYKSYFCDNEHTEVAQQLGKLQYIDQVIIKHEHPVWGGNFDKNDKLYKQNDKHWKHDKALFEKRKKVNFGLPKQVAPAPPPPPVVVTPELPSEDVPTTDTSILLSICIPTIQGREGQFNALLADLEIQRIAHKRYNEIEIIFERDNKEMPIGAKRNLLYTRARGRYAVQIDDDDSVAPDYIAKVVEALQSNPDCVTYLEHCTMDGVVKTARHSNEYKDWADNRYGFDYVRTPFYKDVIRTDMCRRIKFQDIRFAEDHQWARKLKSKRLIRTEVFINEHMYFYTGNSMTKAEAKERYGIRN
jgi:hypothetical protein